MVPQADADPLGWVSRLGGAPVETRIVLDPTTGNILAVQRPGLGERITAMFQSSTTSSTPHQKSFGTIEKSPAPFFNY